MPTGTIVILSRRQHEQHVNRAPEQMPPSIPGVGSDADPRRRTALHFTGDSLFGRGIEKEETGGFRNISVRNLADCTCRGTPAHDRIMTDFGAKRFMGACGG